MTKPLPTTDFRAIRHILEPDDFGLRSEGDDPPPSDQIDRETWAGIMNVPDHVAVLTSDHHGTQLKLLYDLWGDWIIAVGDGEQHVDELFSCMHDAADCFQCALFDLVYGYYRSANANLRTALEVVMIGAFGNLRPVDQKFLDWKRGDDDLGFSYCRRSLFDMLAAQGSQWLFAQNSVFANIYRDLCAFTHARAEATDNALWESTGPVYNYAALMCTFVNCIEVYSLAYVLVKIARPGFDLPNRSRMLHALQAAPNGDEAVRVFSSLFREGGS